MVRGFIFRMHLLLHLVWISAVGPPSPYCTCPASLSCPRAGVAGAFAFSLSCSTWAGKGRGCWVVTTGSIHHTHLPPIPSDPSDLDSQPQSCSVPATMTPRESGHRGEGEVDLPMDTHPGRIHWARRGSQAGPTSPWLGRWWRPSWTWGSRAPPGRASAPGWRGGSGAGARAAGRRDLAGAWLASGRACSVPRTGKDSSRLSQAMGTRVALLGAWDGEGEGVLQWSLTMGSPWSDFMDAQEGDWRYRRTYSKILGEGAWALGEGYSHGAVTYEHCSQSRKMQLNCNINNPRHPGVS